MSYCHVFWYKVVVVLCLKLCFTVSVALVTFSSVCCTSVFFTYPLCIFSVKLCDFRSSLHRGQVYKQCIALSQIYVYVKSNGNQTSYIHSVGLGSFCNLFQLGEFQGGI